MLGTITHLVRICNIQIVGCFQNLVYNGGEVCFPRAAQGMCFIHQHHLTYNLVLLLCGQLLWKEEAEVAPVPLNPLRLVGQHLHLNPGELNSFQTRPSGTYHDDPVQPRFELDAVDLYIPSASMALVTYILVVGYMLGLQERFSPGILATTASSALSALVLEILVIYLTTTIMSITSTLAK